MKYGELLLNKKGIPKANHKPSNFNVEMENQKQFEDRLEKLGHKLKIKENEINEYYFYDAKIDGMRYITMARYKNEEGKDNALKKLTIAQEKLTAELSIDWNSSNKTI